jgi:hypothetical protein
MSIPNINDQILFDDLFTPTYELRMPKDDSILCIATYRESIIASEREAAAERVRALKTNRALYGEADSLVRHDNYVYDCAIEAILSGQSASQTGPVCWSVKTTTNSPTPNHVVWDFFDEEEAEAERYAAVKRSIGDKPHRPWGDYSVEVIPLYAYLEPATPLQEARDRGENAAKIRRQLELSPTELPGYSLAFVALDDLLLITDSWRKLADRYRNCAGGLTNYVEDRPELHSAEKELAKLDEARAALAAEDK